MVPALSYLLVIASLASAAIVSPAMVFAGVVLIKLIDFWGQLAIRPLYENPRVTNVVIAATLAIAVMRVVLRNRPRFDGGLHVWLGVLWLWIYGAFSLTWSWAPEAGAEQWSLYLPYMAIALAAPLIFTSEADFHRAFVATIAMGGFIGGLLLIFATWTGRTISMPWNPADSLWDPLAFGQAAGFFVIMGALSLSRGPKVWLLVRWVAVLIGVLLAARSGSRGQFALMLAVPAVFVWGYRMRSKATLFGVAFVLITFITFVGYFALEQVVNQDERWSEERIKADSQLRIDMISRVLSAWVRDSNTIVLGLGSSASFSPNLVGFYPHVVPLEILAELGLVGFLSFIAILYFLGKKYIAMLRMTRDDSSKRSVGLILGACVFYTLALSFKQGSMVSFSPVIFTYALLLERYVNILIRTQVGRYVSETTRTTQSSTSTTSNQSGLTKWPNLINRIQPTVPLVRRMVDE